MTTEQMDWLDDERAVPDIRRALIQQHLGEIGALKRGEEIPWVNAPLEIVLDEVAKVYRLIPIAPGRQVVGTRPARRTYYVEYRAEGEDSWYECPLCGRLAPDQLTEHGPKHIVEDAST